jgi:hypothetical protein
MSVHFVSPYVNHSKRAREDKPVKLVILRILTCSFLIVSLSYSLVFAQQAQVDKRSVRYVPSKTLYVAQGTKATDLTATQTNNNPLSDQNTTSAAASDTPAQASDAVPGTVPPDGLPSDQNVIGDGEMIGVENGLWEGCSSCNCCAVCGGGYCAPPLWYTDQGARVLARTAPRKTILGLMLYQGTDSSGNPAVAADYVLNTKSIGYDVAAGYNGSIGRYLGRDDMDRDDFLEFSYWGMNTWVASTSIQGTRITDSSTFGRPITFGNLQSPFVRDTYIITGTTNANGYGPGGFNQADLQIYSVNSEMHNWELNLRLRPRGRPDQLVLHPNGRWRRECQPGTYLSYLVGLRYMTIGDGAHLHGEGTIDDDGDNYFVYGDYDVKAENDLLGFQIGADLMFRRCKWSWGVHSKVGPYVNFARNVQDIYNNGAGDPFNTVDLDTRLTARKQIASLIAEVGFEANYKFKPNLMGRAAYDFMWITGLALGPEQFRFPDTPVAAINTNGSIFSHGISLGLEWSW